MSSRDLKDDGREGYSGQSEPLLNDPLFTGLAGTILSPALRSLLIFDAPANGLQRIADHLRLLLEETSGQPVELALLGAFERDDDMWGRLPLPKRTEQGLTLTLHPQIFSPERSTGCIQLLVIPDLARLSLAAARTCTMLVGATVAHLERNEQSAVWQPRQIWLASSRSSEVGAISPHLLDRFALRLTWRDPAQQITRSHEERVADLLKLVGHASDTDASTPDPGEFQLLREAAQRGVEPTAEALERVLDVIDSMQPERYYPRRELALARFALALCQLDGEKYLTTGHVDRAAALLGLQHETGSCTEPLHEPVEYLEPPVVSEPQARPRVSTGTPPLSIETIQSVAAQPQEIASAEPDIFPITIAEHPYPEDSEPAAREAASLRVPFHRFTTGRSDRGPIYGVEASETLEDLAIAATLLTAARFQKLRLKHLATSQPEGNMSQPEAGETKLADPGNTTDFTRPTLLLLDLSDLRRYQRERSTEELLLLLLDHTSIRHGSWNVALLPFLSEAYVRRASISIIQVGRLDAASPLQAELVEGRSLLVPRIGQALEAQAGKATPLAHGLDLAQQFLHRVLQHGRSAIQHVTFVVVSDGRGNVPLEVSRKNVLATLVTREGIDDALNIAQVLRGINRVEKIVLNPQPRYYADLPQRLAEALGATLINIPREPLEREAAG